MTERTIQMAAAWWTDFIEDRQQFEGFYNLLQSELRRQLRDEGEVFLGLVDHRPSEILARVARQSGVSCHRLPPGTLMRVKNGLVELIRFEGTEVVYREFERPIKSAYANS